MHPENTSAALAGAAALTTTDELAKYDTSGNRTLLDAALGYAARGWHVVPLHSIEAGDCSCGAPSCHSPGKHPRTPNGHHDACADEGTIRAWWAEWPGANIGIALAPSELVVLDVDIGPGKRGRESLAAIHAELPDTLTVRTGSGGLHVFYTRPANLEPLRKIGGDKSTHPALDLLADGYVVASPSRHASGGVYRIARDLPIAPLPPVLVELARSKRPARPVSVERRDYPAASPRVIAAARARLDRHGPAVQGQGGDGHTRAAWGILVHNFALAESEARPLIEAWNLTCEPPWDLDELYAGPARSGQSWDGVYGADRDTVEDAAGVDALLEEIDAGEERACVMLCLHPDMCGCPPVAEASESLADLQPKPPTTAELVAHYEAQRDKRRSDTESKLDAKYLRRVLGSGLPLVVADEDAAQALAATAAALVRRAPSNAKDDQLVDLLAKFAPREDAEAAIAEARESRPVSSSPRLVMRNDDGFEIETSGPRAGAPRASQENIALALEKLGVSVRFDELAARMTIARGGAEPVIADDASMTSLWLEIERVYWLTPAKERFFDIVQDRARANPYHPVCEYLGGLTWDGTPRIDSWLVDYAGAADGEYTRAVGRLVLVAAVRRVRQPGCKFDEMLILESEQGTAKSSALRTLAVRDEWFTDDLPLGDDTKRQMEALAGKWIVEAGELKGMRRGDIAALKGLLSRQIDEARMAYGKLPTRAPRQCVIIGSTNDAAYLKDPTGARRFWPIKVGVFDLARLRRDRDQLWAEAAHVEASGASIRLDEGLWGAAAEEQRERQVEDPFRERLEDVLGDVVGKIQSDDVWRILGVDQPTPDQNTRRSDVMRALGWERKRLRFGGELRYCYVRDGDAGRELKLEGGTLAGWRV
ncbi:MAG: hypothetical protein F9K40_13050, partial [Kofleriaceae bacterium]